LVPTAALPDPDSRFQIVLTFEAWLMNLRALDWPSSTARSAGVVLRD
jgi:hypothetical protein